MGQNDLNCTILLNTTDAGESGSNISLVTQDEILKGLESAKVEVKIKALKDAILLLLNGEQLPKVLMYVIRFCSTHENHQLKKILMIYWEVVQKYDNTLGSDGKKKLLPEMILVCNALLNDLNSPNEYIRGCMLRFLCKIKEMELVEPLKDAIKSNLTHRHSYVRRNAVMTVYFMYKNFGDALIPDAPELVEEFLVKETDLNARRNAFMMLFETCQEKAVGYLMNVMDRVSKFGDGFSMVILELTRKVCRGDPSQKSRFVKCIFQLLNANSPAVRYEASWTLITLSSAPTAVRAAAKTYAQLLTSQSDNNLKLIVLDRLEDLKKYHAKVLQEIVMDIMRVLSSPSIDVCEKVLNIAMDLITVRNIEEVVALIKREILKTQDPSMDKNTEYRHLLIKAIHSCAIKFPDVANQVVPLLMEFLALPDGAMDVILFIRVMCESYPEIRKDIIEKLLITLPDIVSSRVYRVAFWIIGEYAEEPQAIVDANETMRSSIGELPLLPTNVQNTADTSGSSNNSVPVTKSIVLADGTYATETVYESPSIANQMEGDGTELRKVLLSGDFFLASAISATLTKMCLRLVRQNGPNDMQTKQIIIDSMIYMCAFIVYGESNFLSKIVIDEDSKQRIQFCMKLLCNDSLTDAYGNAILGESRQWYGKMLAVQKELELKASTVHVPQAQADELISFRQLRGKKALGSTDIDIDDGADINRAVGGRMDGSSEFSGKMRHVHQLTGFADPVYAEAYVTVHDYDIRLEMLVVNRLPQTLSNLTVELSTVGDLKLVERPMSYSIGPLDTKLIHANIKVSSTETGHIFGTIVFDSSAAGAEKTYINLDDIHLDIMDYIEPAFCEDKEFRTMWADFEWENKVAVNTEMTNILSFLNHIITETHMRCMTPLEQNKIDPTSDEDVDFLAVNLYAKSIFGEDALVNLSVEKQESGKITGYIRIRSKTQGIALSLGDRITLVQRNEESAKSGRKKGKTLKG